MTDWSRSVSIIMRSCNDSTVYLFSTWHAQE
jgi:hypothetical protein